MSASKIFLFVSNKIFPFLALPILIPLWTRLGGREFAVLVLGLPFVFGYVVPGIGTNYLKIWRFRGSWMMGNYYIHHGFIYAATLGLAAYIAFIPPAYGSWQTFIGNILRGAGIIGFVGWTHDTVALRAGEMEVYSKEWKRGAESEVVAAHYAPLCFSLLGAGYAGVVTLGYQTLALDKNAASLWWLFPLGLTVMSAAISLPFLSWIKEAIREKVQG